MICYSLKCANDHLFDSWFSTVSTFDTLLKRKMVECTICGSSQIEKALMSPRLSSKKTNAKGKLQKTSEETVIADIKKHVESTSEYVGENFTTEARAMYEGDKPKKSIYGEAKISDAAKLVKEGIPVMPLPFKPKKVTN